MIHIFHHTWSSLEIMCITLTVLLLENIKLFYIKRFFFFFNSNQMFGKSSGDTPDFLNYQESLYFKVLTQLKLSPYINAYNVF